MKAHAYKVVLLVIDHENMGEMAVRETLETNRHVSPHVMGIECQHVDWNDDHPLNKKGTQEEAFRRMFGGVR